ncbi:MAG TPA: tyrosine-protein phosphatase [Thermoanaerobaculia bacterium]|nr:tyrosine-protein phosphatase [Thermoanaerobaculia bacterium]
MNVPSRRIGLVEAVLLALAARPALAAPAPSRPSSWAVAVPAEGVENLYRIESDLYRSARPEGAGFRALAAMGVKSVLDVESPGDDGAARGSALKLFHVPMSAFGLRNDRVLAALRILADPGNRPIVVHCHLGADRTGALIALYRVVVEGWSNEDAIREMDDGGYHHSSWWRNLDRYVAGADVEALRKDLKIGKPAATLAAALGIETAAPKVDGRTSIALAAASTVRTPAVESATAAAAPPSSPAASATPAALAPAPKNDKR